MTGIPLGVGKGGPLRVLSLFAGIGGFDLGLERTGGFQTVAFCEISPHAQSILRRHWPKVKIYEDVREVSAQRLADDGIVIDGIVGGFPCQDLSSAGARAGLAGSRSGLWHDYARLIRELGPGFVGVENSPELLARGFGDVLAALASCGLDAEWDCIPAAALGAPHERDRIWLTAYPPQLSGIHESYLRQELRKWLSNDNHPWATDAWDAPEAGIARMDDGLSDRVDRSARLGNAVIPFIPELIGQALLAAKSKGIAA